MTRDQKTVRRTKKPTNPGGYIGEAMAALPRPRKPKPIDPICLIRTPPGGVPHVQMGDMAFCEPKTCRKVAAWLIRAADWLDAQREEK